MAIFIGNQVYGEIQAFILLFELKHIIFRIENLSLSSLNLDSLRAMCYYIGPYLCDDNLAN